MRIGIDAREAFREKPTGKGLWARYIIQELKVRGANVLLLGRDRDKGIGTKGLLWHLRTAIFLKKKKPVDLYLSPTSFIVPWLLGNKFPYAIVVHDLIAFDREPHERKAKFIERLTLPKALTNAKHIFTVSDATKADLIKRFPKLDASKVTTVYEGPTVSKQSAISNRQSIGTRTVLCIGTLCPRKNQLRLIRAWNRLPKHLRISSKLILAGGRGWRDDEIVLLAEHSPGTEWRGYVAEDELRGLLTNATFLVLPSLKEGFGLPVLDAMTLGVPVLTSNRSSMKEITGNAALLVDPEDIDAIAKGLERLLTDENLRKDLSEKGKRQAEKFSWERTVDLMIEALNVSC